LAELTESLSTGRDRDPTGLLLSRKYVERDLTVALVEASATSPVTVAFLDMNGLKTINDTWGHDEGDKSIRTYLQTINSFVGGGVEAYRGDGGDEVVVVLRGTSISSAKELMQKLLGQLGGERIKDVALAAACGLSTTPDPNTDAAALIDLADKAMYRAKRKKPASAIATDGSDEVELVG
jgi:diguanylate cyclase (GGDEF)-like protein